MVEGFEGVFVMDEILKAGLETIKRSRKLRQVIKELDKNVNEMDKFLKGVKV